jgi:hypothetical protein
MRESVQLSGGNAFGWFDSCRLLLTEDVVEKHVCVPVLHEQALAWRIWWLAVWQSNVSILQLLSIWHHSLDQVDKASGQGAMRQGDLCFQVWMLGPLLV